MLAAEVSGRAGRLSDVQGAVSLYDTETGQWDEALRNRALTEGDRLSTAPGARAEVRIGSTELRIGPGAELEFLRLDDDRMVFQLWRGNLAVRVRSREIASEVEVRTREARVMPERAGHFRVDREDDTTWASVWRGAVRVETPDQRFDVTAGRRADMYFQPRDGATVVSWSSTAVDAFADAVARDEERDERSASHRHVSPEMTGVEDLDRHGRWERHPEFGMVWRPLSVAVGWAPFRHGRWVWHVRWGWTWLDAAPWGFAPFHYGRWVLWGTRWVWSPGTWVHRPVFAPALVTWGPSPGVSVSITFGRHTPPTYWNPLPPRQPYVPAFTHRPHYHEAVNRPHLTHNPQPPAREPVMSAPGQPVAVVPYTRPAPVVSGGSLAPAPVAPVTVSPGAYRPPTAVSPAVAAPQSPRPPEAQVRPADPREARDGREVRDRRREDRREDRRDDRRDDRRTPASPAAPATSPKESRQDDRRPQHTEVRPREGRDRQSLL